MKDKNSDEEDFEEMEIAITEPDEESNSDEEENAEAESPTSEFR